MRLILSLLLIACLSVPAYAAYKGPGGDNQKAGGFKGPVSGAMAETVEAAKKLDDKSRVVLVGNITYQLAGSRDEYMFKDNTGEILVEISPKAFRNLEITPDDKVRISGKVDKDFGKDVEIDVKTIEKVN